MIRPVCFGFVLLVASAHGFAPKPIATNGHVSPARTLIAARATSKDDGGVSSLFDEQLVNDFCQGTNGCVVKPVRDYVEIKPAGSAGNDTLVKLTAPPEVPGLPRPVWLTILGSVPTALGWYGYYKFSVEEELYQYELQTEGKVTGCGGYGTLFPFVYGVIVGFPLSVLHIPGGETILQAAGLWILLGQVNLYRRVNEICEERKGDLGLDEPPLHTWWALLPPPLDVVVGLRQVHFLSEYWRTVRNEPYQKDVIAEELFPFISSERFTLKQFVRQPSRWFWFTKDWKDFDQFEFLKD
eukprot:CAMPEP_0113594418 /NCGR_PEP_ID=MMETSP0015_2-20120614/39074_1 /TAXON_ID=2838 /ORGANISM="Odontella" /LENGTH=296 /DNA_ID=CAMNT_0000501429 /DNA_START=78 /DNA_END=968 /DNA_ORIENTATION=- /assembly_acc=CAM_ASM_000160